MLNGLISVQLGLVVDGATLAFALKEEVKLSFLALARQTKVVIPITYRCMPDTPQAVVACRTTPLQKALVVQLVKVQEKVSIPSTRQ
jgi:magnesium-transporting ATPase (P-type)